MTRKNNRFAGTALKTCAFMLIIYWHELETRASLDRPVALQAVWLDRRADWDGIGGKFLNHDVKGLRDGHDRQ